MPKKLPCLLPWPDWGDLIMSTKLRGNSLPFNTTELLEKAQQYDDEADLSARGSHDSSRPAKVPPHAWVAVLHLGPAEAAMLYDTGTHCTTGV